MTLHRVVDAPFRATTGNKPIAGIPLDLSHPICKGLVRYWHFGEGGGAQVADILNAAGASLKGTNTTWAGGPSLSFDGSTSFADSLNDTGVPGILPQVGQFQFFADNASCTVMAWFNPVTPGAGLFGCIAGRWDDQNGPPQSSVWGLFTRSDNKLDWYYQSNDAFGDVNKLTTASTFTANTWNHVVARYCNTLTTSQIGCFVNGVLNTGQVIAFSQVPTTTPALSVGYSKNTGGASTKKNFYQGKILTLAIWKRYLSDLEAQTLYFRPWEIFLESNQRRWFRVGTTPCQPLVPRLTRDDMMSDRGVRFSEIVNSILNSLLIQCQIIPSGQNQYTINLGGQTGLSVVTSFDTRTGDVVLQPSDLPIFSSIDRGAVPASGGGTVNFIRADGTWVTAVQSVALTMPAEFTVSGSPVTGSGTFAVTKATATANTVWAGPTSGPATAPTFRALVAADLPGGSLVNSVSNSDGTLTISPTTGAVVASINLAHANTWTAQQTFNAATAATFGAAGGNTGKITFLGTTSGTVTVTVATAAGTWTFTLPTSAGSANQVLQTDGTGIASWASVANSVSNSDGTLTISPTTGAVVASLALGHANTWTANVTIDATHHLLLSEMTQGSVLFAGASGQVSQDNSKLFWDDGNFRLGILTAAPSWTLHILQSTAVAGPEANIDSTQTQVNTVDTQRDSGIKVSKKISVSSASNQAALRAADIVVQNNLSGGGSTTLMNGIEVGVNTAAGAATGTGHGYVATFSGAGSITRADGFLTNVLAGTTANGFTCNSLGPTNGAAFLAGTAPTGLFCQYMNIQQPNFFLGWLRQQQGRARVTADVNNATATFSNLTDLTISNLVASRNYIGRMSIKCVNTVAAEGIQFDFNGGSATMTNFWAAAGVLASSGADTNVANISTSLAGVINWSLLTGETVIDFDIAFTVNAAGTLIPRFAENTTATGTATVRLGSFIILEDSPN